MSVEEGWTDLRRRLPPMNRAYVRQRNARLAVRSLVLVGISAIAFVLLEMRTKEAGVPPPAPFVRSSAPRVSSTPAEAAVDAATQIEAKENQGQR